MCLYTHSVEYTLDFRLHHRNSLERTFCLTLIYAYITVILLYAFFIIIYFPNIDYIILYTIWCYLLFTKKDTSTPGFCKVTHIFPCRVYLLHIILRTFLFLSREIFGNLYSLRVRLGST